MSEKKEAAAPVAAPPKRRAPKNAIPDEIDLYGLPVPRGIPILTVELQCYRENAHLRSLGAKVLSPEEHFKNAWRGMWPKYEWSEWVEMIVHAWSNYKWISMMGAERSGKTWNVAHATLLDYCADPTVTLASVSTVTFEGLKLRMWSDIMHAYDSASLRFPFTIRSTSNEMRCFMAESAHEAAEKFQIHGMAISRTKDAEGRIRGGHAPRRVVVIDEAENMPPAIFDAVINPMSAPYGRCVMISNPMLRVSRFGEFCEPEGGWGGVHDTDVMWRTKKGGLCLHFDGLQSPNVRRGKNVFTGIFPIETPAEVEKIHGVNSPQWWSLVRGWPVPDGIVSRVFPDAVIEKGKPSRTWDFRPGKCASLDPAFEFDQCVLHVGELGFPVFGERRFAINAIRSETIKFTIGPHEDPKDYQIAHRVMALCKAEGIEPKHFIMDTTGGGRGVYAILQKEWSRDVQSCDYGGAATDRPVRADDSKKSNELYKWFVSELWFRAAECVKDGLITGLSNLDSKTIEDLTSRLYENKGSTVGTLMQVESKAEVKKKLGRSPDHGDAFVQWGELLFRLGTMPGGRMRDFQGGTRWQRHRERAIAASKVYETEYAEFR